jgi:hemolysin III
MKSTTNNDLESSMVQHSYNTMQDNNDNHYHEHAANNAAANTPSMTAMEAGTPNSGGLNDTLTRISHNKQHTHSRDALLSHAPSALSSAATSTSSSYVSWKLAQVGHTLPDRSRDGSIHVTDEVFNSASHLAALLLSILGTALLVTQASTQHDVWKIVSFSLYGASLCMLFGASTMHHALEGPMQDILRCWDYVAIYPLIAGTFTPLCLVFFHHDAIGWIFLGVVWGISLLCMVALLLWFEKLPKWWTMTTYVTLGWLGACMGFWLWPKLGAGGFAWLIIGGIVYTVGGYIFITEEPNPYPGRFGFHEIWHVAVVLGALSHWWLMYAYVLPYGYYYVQPADNNNNNNDNNNNHQR